MEAIDDDAELLALARRCGWKPLFEPERAKLREKEIRLSHARTRIVGYPGVVQTLTLLIGFDEGSTVSTTWNTIFVNNAKKQLESDKVCQYIIQRIY